MNQRLEQSVDLWYEVTDTLNQIILSHGEIDINNKTIWGKYLNVWTNEDWILLLEAMAMLLEQQPDLFKEHDIRNFRDAAMTIVKYEDQYSRVLDKKAHKKIAWRTLMSLREVWNRSCAITLPNHDTSRQHKELLEFN